MIYVDSNDEELGVGDLVWYCGGDGIVLARLLSFNLLRSHLFTCKVSLKLACIGYRSSWNKSAPGPTTLSYTKGEAKVSRVAKRCAVHSQNRAVLGAVRKINFPWSDIFDDMKAIDELIEQKQLL